MLKSSQKVACSNVAQKLFQNLHIAFHIFYKFLISLPKNLF